MTGPKVALVVASSAVASTSAALAQVSLEYYRVTVEIVAGALVILKFSSMARDFFKKEMKKAAQEGTAEHFARVETEIKKNREAYGHLPCVRTKDALCDKEGVL